MSLSLWLAARRVGSRGGWGRCVGVQEPLPSSGGPQPPLSGSRSLSPGELAGCYHQGPSWAAETTTLTSRAASEIVQHPDYDQLLSAKGGADIALLRLEAPVRLSPHVQVVSLPPASLTVPERKMCWVTGWGRATFHCRFGET